MQCLCDGFTGDEPEGNINQLHLISHMFQS
jgi:hypothetical protein